MERETDHVNRRANSRNCREERKRELDRLDCLPAIDNNSSKRDRFEYQYDSVQQRGDGEYATRRNNTWVDTGEAGGGGEGRGSEGGL